MTDEEKHQWVKLMLSKVMESMEYICGDVSLSIGSDCSNNWVLLTLNSVEHNYDVANIRFREAYEEWRRLNEFK